MILQRMFSKISGIFLTKKPFFAGQDPQKNGF